MKLTIIALAAIFSFGSAGAFATESGPLARQLVSAGEPIRIASTEWGEAYRKIESVMVKKWSRGADLFSELDNFDFDVSRHAAAAVDLQVIKTTRPQTLNLSTAGHLKESLPNWSLPIYEYAEGIPESRVRGNYGVVVQPYEKANDELRDPAPDSAEMTAWVASLREALTHVPKYEGLSFRGIRLERKSVEKYYPLGETAIDPAFISTSMRIKVAARFALAQENRTAREYEKVGVILIISGKTGRPISTFADNHDDEAEILFANGTSFKVVKKSPLFKLKELHGLYQFIFLQEKT